MRHTLCKSSSGTISEREKMNRQSVFSTVALIAGLILVPVTSSFANETHSKTTTESSPSGKVAKKTKTKKVVKEEDGSQTEHTTTEKTKTNDDGSTETESHSKTENN